MQCNYHPIFICKHFFVVYIAFFEKKTIIFFFSVVYLFWGVTSPCRLCPRRACGVEEMGRGKDGLSFCRCCHDRAKGLRKVVLAGGELWYECFFGVIQLLVQQFCFRIFCLLVCFFVLLMWVGWVMW